MWEIWLHAGSIEGGREKGRCDGQGRRGGAETQVVSAKHAGAFEDIAWGSLLSKLQPATGLTLWPYLPYNYRTYGAGLKLSLWSQQLSLA